MNTNKTHENGKLVPISDIACNASLACKSIFPVELDRQNPKHVVFLFKVSLEFQNTVDAFWNRSLLVEPQSFYQNLKSLKARIYEDRGGQ